MATAKKSLGEHLSEIMAIVGYVQKDAVNKFHNYRYASADAVLTKVREELSQRKIHIEREPDSSYIVWQNEDRIGEDGTHVVKGGTNVIFQWSGYFVLGEERIAFCGLGQGSDKTDKASMKAETAALKYALAGSFLISWGDDPEAVKEDPSATTPAKPRKATSPKKPRGAVKEDPTDVAPIVAKLREAASLEALEELGAAIKRLTIREQDKPALTEAYKTRKQELSP